ncbi:quinolinate synthetase complex, A subunit [mine drainage metagenome]|uniref:quinolinate synthase n=1 Tax=mine drainage metagenome TaxID=410659 RepID=T1B5L4_9ZZZZ
MNTALERRPDRLYERVRAFVPALEWPVLAAEIDAILELKRTQDAVILAHNYQTPEIYHCVADVVGDSLQLAREAARLDARVIVMAGVYFMAETAKLINPDKLVLIPDPQAGCSLAESITAEDVRALRERHPGVPVVTYVNTSAQVKAESDISCTSSNARRVVESLGSPQVILIPDRYLAANVARETQVTIIPWNGRCVVHEQFGAEEVRELRRVHPDLTVLAHPECTPEVVEEADFSGSTTALSRYISEKHPIKVALLTECSMSDNVSVEHPEIQFIRPCNLCPHMKRITLAKIRESLLTLRHAVEIEAGIADRARRSVERMLAI